MVSPAGVGQGGRGHNRLEPRAGGTGIYWYGDGRSHAAQVDSTGAGTTVSMELECPVFAGR